MNLTAFSSVELLILRYHFSYIARGDFVLMLTLSCVCTMQVTKSLKEDELIDVRLLTNSSPVVSECSQSRYDITFLTDNEMLITC